MSAPRRVFVCRECGYPSRLFECDNPGCLANSHSNHAVLRENQARYKARAAEETLRLERKKRLRRAGFTPAF